MTFQDDDVLEVFFSFKFAKFVTFNHGPAIPKPGAVELSHILNSSAEVLWDAFRADLGHSHTPSDGVSFHLRRAEQEGRPRYASPFRTKNARPREMILNSTIPFLPLKIDFQGLSSNELFEELY